MHRFDGPSGGRIAPRARAGTGLAGRVRGDLDRMNGSAHQIPECFVHQPMARNLPELIFFISTAASRNYFTADPIYPLPQAGVSLRAPASGNW